MLSCYRRYLQLLKLKYDLEFSKRVMAAHWLRKVMSSITIRGTSSFVFNEQRVIVNENTANL